MTVSSTEWMAQGSCVTQGIDPDIFFPVDSRGVAIAKLYCQDCPVRLECLSYALQADERFGVWGGTSERERHRIKRAQREASEGTFVRVA